MAAHYTLQPQQELDMNKTTRNKLDKLHDRVIALADAMAPHFHEAEAIRLELEDLATEERDAFDSLTERAQEGERGQRMDEAAEAMEACLDCLDASIVGDWVDALAEAGAYLDQAKGEPY